jgi:hypothetical protein
MEYKTHKPVPTFELESILQRFQKQQQEKSTASNKKGNAFNI